jgi:predicted enzyme involved in methoxymalonyl-ACP biosynthesis
LCGMWAKIRMAKEPDLVRIAELVSRAHRMAAAALPFDALALFQIMEAEGLYVMECGDVFGDYGLSGVAVCVLQGLIALLVVSCRLRGKGYGSALVAHLIQKHGGSARCLWRETEYNKEVRALFEWFGFKLRNLGDLVCGSVQDCQLKGPDWIRVEVE